MSDVKIEGFELKPGFKGMAKDTGSDQTMFKGVQWGKVMMWIFLLSDTFVFSCFCLLYTSPSPRDGLLSRMPSSA